MNKVILSLLLAVCVLGMALIMLNERLGRKSDPQPAPQASMNTPAVPDNKAGLPPLPGDSRDNEPASPASAPEQAARQPDLPDLPPLPKDPVPEVVLPSMEREKTQAAAPPVPSAEPGAESPPAPAEKIALQPANQPSADQPEKKATPKESAGKAAGGKETAKETANKAAQTERAAKPVTEKAAPQGQAARSITRFVVFARETGATVRLVGSSPISYKTMSLSNPERVVVDLDGQWQIKAPGVPNNPLVSNVRVGKLGDRTRVVIDLKAKPARSRFVLSKDRDTLDVRVDQ